jgi:hypothetical protein
VEQSDARGARRHLTVRRAIPAESTRDVVRRARRGCGLGQVQGGVLEQWNDGSGHYSLADGIRLGNALSPDQRAQLREIGTRGLHSQHYHWNKESWFSKDTVSALADALENPLDQIMKEAEEAQFKRNTQAMAIADPDITNCITIPQAH